MTRSVPSRHVNLVLAASLLLAGCPAPNPATNASPTLAAGTAASATASAAPGAKASATPGTPSPSSLPIGSSGASAITLPGGVVVPPDARVVHVIADPRVGNQVTVADYWDYGRDAPFKVSDYKSVASPSTLGPQYGEHVTVTAQTSVLTLLQPNYRVMDLGASATGAPMATGCDPLPPMTIGGTSATSAAPIDTPVGNASASLDIPTTDNAQPVGTAMDTSDVSPADVADANDAGALSPTESGPDPSFPPVSQAAQDLSAPHQVSYDGDIPLVQSNTECLVAVTDQTSGAVLKLSFDQAYEHFSLSNQAGTLTFEINPDRTFLINGAGAADVAAALPLLEANPVIKSTSLFSMAFLVARLGRLAPTLSRAPTNCELNRDNVYRLPAGYRLLGAGTALQNNQGTCYVILDALLKELVVKAGKPAAQ